MGSKKHANRPEKAFAPPPGKTRALQWYTEFGLFFHKKIGFSEKIMVKNFMRYVKQSCAPSIGPARTVDRISIRAGSAMEGPTRQQKYSPIF